VRAGLPEVPAILGSASANAAISCPGGGKKAYTMKIIASVIRPAVKKKSAHRWCVIFCHAPKITIAAPTQTITFTSLSVDLETPAIVQSLISLEIGFKGSGKQNSVFD
jgi:hypothetical protein